jgi:acetolactate synthase-1/2/3 large subunit
MKSFSVSEHIVKLLEEKGIEQAFSVTGGAAMHLNHAFGKSVRIKTTYLHHEQACAMAAEGYARITNKPAIVVVTAGPGALNSLNGIFGAFTDSIPMIVIAGQVKTETLMTSYKKLKVRQLGDQEINSTEIVRTLTKFYRQITKPDDVEIILEKAINEAVAGRPGPVWVEIPIDIQGQEMRVSKSIRPEKNKISKRQLISDKQLNKVLNKIYNAKRPVILAGCGVRSENKIEELLEFAESFQIPILTAWTHDLISSDHPLFVGRPGTIGTRPGNFVIQNCDLLLIIGSQLNIRQISYNWSGFAKNAFKIWVDIDSAELNKPFPKVNLKINSSVGVFLQSVSEKLLMKKFKYDSKKWLKWCREIGKKYDIKNEVFVYEKNRINPYELVPYIIAKSEQNGIFVCGNATACIVPFQTGFLTKQQRLFSNSGSASMGYDLPAAIGAAIAAPNRQVICFAGDGSVMMNIQELQSLFNLELNVKLVILDNEGYMSIKQTQNNFFKRKYGSDTDSGLALPDFALVSRSFGLPVKTLNNIFWKRQIKKALGRKGPQILIAKINTNQEFTPRLKSKMTSTGMVSPELDDMYPNLGDLELAAVKASVKNW